MKDTWCVLPWVHLCIRTDNVLKPCCRFLNETDKDLVPFNNIENKGIEIMQADSFVELRNSMLAGKESSGCQKCYSQEKKNSGTSISMRQHYNEMWADIKKENCTEQFSEVRYIEMSVDNICNLQCKMCDSKFSSKLIKRDKFLGNKVYKKLEPNFRKLSLVDLSDLQKVKILGGEPFITPNFEKFVDFLIEKSNPSNITITIITNGTSIPSKSLIEKLNKFKFIDLDISLDAYDISNDYQRFGGNYKQVIENSLKYKEIFNNFDYSFHSTITIYTANKLSKTINFFEKIEIYHSVDFVRHPEHLSLLYIPKNLADWFVSQNKDNNTAVSLITNFLKESQYNDICWKNFYNTTNKLDKYYKTSLNNYNPDLYNFLNDNNWFLE
jgi:organic radical activating enzyme